MGRWRQAPEHHWGERKANLPMGIARIWYAANRQRCLDELAKTDPDDALSKTGGVVGLREIAKVVLDSVGAEREALAALGCELGRALAATHGPSSRWTPASPLWDQNSDKAVMGELMDMLGGDIGESQVWKDRGTLFRKAANRLRTVKKIQES